MSERAIVEKRKLVDEIKDKISRARVMVVSDYLGFTVKEITSLRKKLRGEDSEFRVFKNTLMGKAVLEAGYPQLKDFFKGPTAVLLGYKDAVSPLKVLVKFIKEVEKGTLRAGVVEKTVFDPSALSEMAKLPSREILLARVVGGFQAPIYGLANVLQGTLRKLVYALDQIKTRKGGE